MKLRNISPISRVVSGAAFTWQTTVKGGRALGAALARVLHLRDGGVTARWYTATINFGRYVVRLQRQGGWLYVVKWLKTASVLLQQAAGGQRIHATQALGAAVARTRGSGIPRVIPAVMRKSIRAGDPWTIRIWLSYFQLYRVIEIPGVLKLQSITAPSEMKTDFLRGWILFLNEWLPYFFREIGYNHLATSWISRRSQTVTFRDVHDSPGGLISVVAAWTAGWITFEWEGIPFNLKPRLLALFKSGPNSGGTHNKSWVDGRVARKDSKGKPLESFCATNTGAILSDVSQWGCHPELFKYFKEWLGHVQDRVLSRILHLGKEVNDWTLEVMTNKSHPDYNPDYSRFNFPGYGRPKGLGKLGYQAEPAGKIRVFAMVDSLTQCAMKPLHDLLFSFLRRIETDGTFDQIRPAQRLINLGYRSFWSLDLSSATDRFPLALQQTLLSVIIGPRMAELWARILVEREYLTPKAPKGVKGPDADTPLIYGAGQPMGALTSWAAFSLTHHVLVQYAAYRALGLVGFFKEYALLGDDIVIANHAVTLAYQALLLEIGVEYGLAKSLISSTGGFEFAKRTFARGKDVSGISLMAVGVAKADHAVLEQILTRFGTNSTLMETLRRAAKVLGYGYRAVARLPAVLQTKSRLQGLCILLSRPGAPWGLPVMEWLLQKSPGVIRTIPEDTRRAIGERLWDSLKAKTELSLQRHLDGLMKVIYPDSAYGGNIDVWYDKSALQESFWNVYICLPLVGELKIELKDLQKRLNSLSRPDLDDLTEIWERIEEIRDAIAAIPSTPNFFERNPLDFGGEKRSALIRTFRSVQSWLTTELARTVNSNVYGSIRMAMDSQEGPLDLQIHEEVQVVETPEVTNADPERDLEIPVPGGPIVMLSPRFGFVCEIRQTPSGPAFHKTYVLDGKTVFMESDIHLDGVLHREDLPYSLVLSHLDPEAKARVLERIRSQQYEEMSCLGDPDGF